MGGTPKLPAQDPPTPGLDLGLETLEGGEGGVQGPCNADAHKLSTGPGSFTVIGGLYTRLLKTF